MCTIDLPHPAGPEGGDDFIRAEPRARSKCHTKLNGRRIIERPAGAESAFEPPDNLEESLDRSEPIERLDHPVQIKRHVFVNHDVPESRQPFELRDEIGRKLPVSREVPHGIGVVLEPVPAAR